MATLAADTPQTYQGSKIELDEPEILDGTVFQGSALVESSTAGRLVKHTAETAGFAGMALAGGVQGETINVKPQCFWVGSIQGTIVASNKGAPVYLPASTDNLEDADLTSTTQLPIGRLHRVVTAGAFGTNKVVLFLQAESLRSL